MFELETSNDYGNLLNEALADEEFKKIEEPEQRYILNLLRHYEENKKVPYDFY